MIIRSKCSSRDEIVRSCKKRFKDNIYQLEMIKKVDYSQENYFSFG